MRITIPNDYTELYTLVSGATASTKFKVQVMAGRITAQESASQPDVGEGYQFGNLEMFTSTAEFGQLWVRATGTAEAEVTIADTGFSSGISPFIGASGTSTGGGGGSSETPASITQKYESNADAKIQKAFESANHQVIGSVLQTTYTTFDGSKVETQVNLPTSGGGSGDHDAVSEVDNIYQNDQLITRVTLQSGAVIESNPVSVTPESMALIPAGSNGDLVRLENGVLVASSDQITIEGHKLKSAGDALSIDSKLAVTHNIGERPYIYKSTGLETGFETIPSSEEQIVSQGQLIEAVVGSGAYIISENSIKFDTVSPFVFTIFSNGKPIYKATSKTNPELEIDSESEIYFQVTDSGGAPQAVGGQFEVQKFEFDYKPAEKTFLAYEGEGQGGGGEYPKNPTFETVITESFAGIDANRFVSFLNDKVAIESDTSIDLKIEGSDSVTIDADEINAGFKEIVGIQGGSKSSSAVNLAQVQSMLKNLFLQRVTVTLENNQLDLGADFAGKNVFVSGSGLDSGVILDASNFSDYQVVQVTKSSEYENAALPLQLVESDREIRYLVQGTTSFGIYGGRWLVLSDATVTLAEVTQRAGFQQYVAIQAGQGMTSRVDSFGTMTLDVVSSGGDPSVEVDDNYLMIAKNKVPVQSAFYQDLNRLVLDGGAVIGGHVIEAAGEALNSNDGALVKQGVNSLYEYQRPKIFIETLASDTHFTVNQTNQSFAKVDGQQINISADYTYLRIHRDTLHFQPNSVGNGYKFVIQDQHENVVFVHESNQSFSAISTVYVKVPIVNLRCNKDYHFFVYDLKGAPLLLKGSGGIQKFGFDFQYLDQADLVIHDDIVLPDSPTFQHVQTLRISDLTNQAGLTFNSAGLIESDCNISLGGHQLLDVGEATSPHHAPNLGQVNQLISAAEFVQSFAIDGYIVDALELDEDTFSYEYKEHTRVMTLSVIGQHGGGGNTSGGTVYPIIIDEDVMNGYLCEFASKDGNAIRSSGTKAQALIDGIGNANQLADKAEKTAIGAASTAAAATAAAGANAAALVHQTAEIAKIHAKIVGINEGALSQQREIGQLRREVRTLETNESRHESEIKELERMTQVADTNFHQISDSLSIVYRDIDEIEGSVAALNGLGLERTAAGEFEEAVSVADSFDTASSSSSHYMTPRSTEIIYHLPPERRTADPVYSVGLKVDGVRAEVLRAGAGKLSAVNQRLTDLLDGAEDTDGATVGQVKGYLQQIADRLDIIEAELGIAAPPEVFSVYSGRIADRITTDPLEIQGCGAVQSSVTAETLLGGLNGSGYVVRGHNGSEFENASYSVIAYPKGVLTPNPESVEYEGFRASRGSFEIMIDSVRYIVLVPDTADISPIQALYKLAQ
jgi:hypothetical protein